MLNALAAALRGGNPLTLSTHRLRRGLPGYLIPVCSPRFRASASVTDQRVAFATGVPPHIYAFHRYTWNSTSPLLHSSLPVSNDPPRLSRGAFTSDLKRPPARFTPNKSGQRLPPTYYRGCWHVVSRGFLVRYRQGTSSYSYPCSSLTTVLYDPKTFFIHAALLRQTFVHCGRFPYCCLP